MTLSEIKKKLNTFQIYNCGLHHEIVQLDPKTHLPLKTGTLEEPMYKRVPLCCLKDRKRRLGCSHTTANDAFIHFIEELAKKDQVIEKLKNQLQELLVQIYMLDHKKGNLEKNFAETLEVNNSCVTSLSEVQKQIDTCKGEHTKLLKQLGTIKSNIIQRLEKRIAIQTESEILH